jgi:hypothetical protein
MVFENDHASRSISLDGRPHLGQAFRFFMGDSVGRWEGNTLVVDTTNLNGNAEFGRDFPYYSDAMHVIERFTVVDANSIDYEIVYDDQKLFTRPIKSVGYLNVVSWSFEMGAPAVLLRRGFTKESVKPGIEVVVDGYHAKSGGSPS